MTPLSIVVLEGFANNPGDLSRDALESHGTVTAYDRMPRSMRCARAHLLATAYANVSAFVEGHPQNVVG